MNVKSTDPHCDSIVLSDEDKSKIKNVCDLVEEILLKMLRYEADTEYEYKSRLVTGYYHDITRESLNQVLNVLGSLQRDSGGFNNRYQRILIEGKSENRIDPVVF